MASFPSKSTNPYEAVVAQTYRFQGATLEADHPPSNANDNRVATTGWVTSLVTASPMYPRVTDAGGLGIHVSTGVVSTPSGTACNIKATTTPIAVVASSTEYVYIRYSDCSIVVSTVAPGSNLGTVIAEVITDQVKIISIKNFGNINNWASLQSPYFSGIPKAPHPKKDDCSNQIATTGWICDKLKDFLFNVAPNDIPRVIDAGGLTINVTQGEIVLPTGSTCTGTNCRKGGSGATDKCLVNPLINPISVIANADGRTNPKENIWVRYKDCTVVATTTKPSLEEGLLLAEVITDSNQIVKITQVGGTLLAMLIQYFSMGYGGKLIYHGSGDT